MQRTTITLAALLAALVLPLAGCIEAAPETALDPAADAPVDATAPLVIPNNASDCVEAIAVLLVPMAHAQSLLPEGFTAMEAGMLFDAPVPAGRGAVFFNGYDCPTADVGADGLRAAELGVFVEAPTLEPDLGLAPAGGNIYQLSLLTESAAQREAIAPTGFPVVEATVETTVEDLGAIAGGVVTVSDAEGQLYTFEFGAPNADKMTDTFRFWHATESGIAWFEYAVKDSPLRVGTLASCSIREGSIVAEAAGTTSCKAGESLALVFPSQTWISAFHHHPGVHAVAG